MSKIIFIIGITLMIIGFSHQLTIKKHNNREIEFVPRSVFDEIAMSTGLN
jgi:hypothetical protein